MSQYLSKNQDVISTNKGMKYKEEISPFLEVFKNRLDSNAVISVPAHSKGVDQVLVLAGAKGGGFCKKLTEASSISRTDNSSQLQDKCATGQDGANQK